MTSVTTRWTFLIVLGAGVLAVPRGSLAQQQAKVARIGFLYYGSRQSSADRYNAFVQGMREFGYVEGTNFIIEAGFADGGNERLPALAAELVRLKVDVIVATGSPVLRALQHATTIILVVATIAGDPVGDGYAASMARPGGNVTGLSIGAADLGSKLLELLKAAVPKLSRVAVLLQPENLAHPPRLKRIMSAAQKVGIQVVLAEAGTVQEIEREFTMMAKERVNAAIILSRFVLRAGGAPNRGAGPQPSVAVGKHQSRIRQGRWPDDLRTKRGRQCSGRERHLTDPRTGRNFQFALRNLCRQSIDSRLTGYEDTNDAERAAEDPTFRTLASREWRERSIALTSTLHWFETDVLTEEPSTQGLAHLNTDLVRPEAARAIAPRLILDIDSSESPVQGGQEQSAYNRHFESVCYASCDPSRRVIAKVEHHPGELFPRVGFIVTTLTGTSRSIVHFYNQRGTAEQWIKEGKEATHWTRLSCHRSRANEVRLLLGVSRTCRFFRGKR